MADDPAASDPSPRNSGYRRRESVKSFAMLEDAGVAPTDGGGMVYTIFFVLGVATLLPWNVFINCGDYFGNRLTGTSFENNYENFFGICFNVTNVISLGLSTIIGGRISMYNRIVVPLILQAVVFSITTALVMIPPSSMDGNTLFAVTIPTCLISGLLTALLQGGLFGLAAKFPPKYSQAVMGGQGLGGAGVSLTKLLTLAAAKASATTRTPLQAYEDTKMSNFAYFFIASIFSLASVVGYLALEKLPFAQYYIKGGGQPPAQEPTDKSKPLLEEEDDEAGDEGDGFARFQSVWSQIKDKMLAVGFVFFVTLSVFPSVTVHIQSVTNYDDPPHHGFKALPKSGRFFGDVWIPFMFLMFNGFDFAGRVLAGVSAPALHALIPPQRLSTWSLVRIIFVPLFLFCNVRTGKVIDDGYVPHRNMFPRLFMSDAAPLLVMFAFALSNGYISSRLMMVAPSLVRPNQAELAGMCMALFLTCGLALGSVISFFVGYLICSCNPFNG